MPKEETKVIDDKGMAQFLGLPTSVICEEEKSEQHISLDILFNHEGLRRGEEFVTRKITMGVAKIRHLLDNNIDFKPLQLGNINARRDWSDSEDFVRAVWLMLNQEEPKE